MTQIPPPVPRPSTPSGSTERQRKLALAGIWTGVALATGPLWGAMASIAGGMLLLRDIGDSGNISESSDRIATSVAFTAQLVSIGRVAGFVGAAIFIPSLILKLRVDRSRARAGFCALQRSVHSID